MSAKRKTPHDEAVKVADRLTRKKHREGQRSGYPFSTYYMGAYDGYRASQRSARAAGKTNRARPGKKGAGKG